MFFANFEATIRENPHSSPPGGSRTMGPGHRLREQGGLQQADRVLLAGEAAKSCRRGSPAYPARNSGKVFGLIPSFKSKDESAGRRILQIRRRPQADGTDAIPAIKTYFKAYVSSDQIRHIIDTGDLTRTCHEPRISHPGLQSGPGEVPHAHS